MSAAIASNMSCPASRGMLGRSVGIERQFLDLRREHRAVAARRIRQPARDIGVELQTVLARQRHRQPIGVAALGWIACEQHRAVRALEALHQLGVALECAGDQHHRIARRGRLHQRLYRGEAGVGRALDANVTRPAEQRHRRRLVGEQRGIGRDPRRIEIDSLGVRPQRLGETLRQRPRTRFVGTVEKIAADRRIGRIQRALDRRALGHAQCAWLRRA